MDINLPLILMIAVAVTGVVWLLDILILAGPRRKRVAVVEAKFADQMAGKTEEEKAKDEAYVTAIHAAHSHSHVVDAVVEFSKSFFPVLALVFALRSFLIEPFQIPSGSMIPTLEVGDFIVVNKFTYGIRLPVIRTKILDINQPKRGDVVVFFPPNEERYFIKRLIGLPGDTIRYENHQLFINDVEVPQSEAFYDTDKRHRVVCPSATLIVTEEIAGESYQTRKCSTRTTLSGTWIVPDGHYFMMGDNRDDSLDSRAWKEHFVPDENIVGKAFAVWMHWDSGLPSFKPARFIE